MRSPRNSPRARAFTEKWRRSGPVTTIVDPDRAREIASRGKPAPTRLYDVIGSSTTRGAST